MFYIYKITNKLNGKIYIGKTNNINKRWLGHISKAKYSFTKLSRAICKYGSENFIIEQIDCAETEVKIYEKEKYWIEKLNSRDSKIGYNIAFGGLGGFCGKLPNAEVRKKMSMCQKNRIRKPLLPQIIDKIKKGRARQILKRYTLEFKNKILSEYNTYQYTKQQLADKYNLSFNGICSIIKQSNEFGIIDKYVVSEETRQKLRIASTGRKASNETKRKISLARQGKRNGPTSLFLRQQHSQKLKLMYKNGLIHRKIYFSDTTIKKCIDAFKRKNLISKQTKLDIIIDYDTGNYTKKDLSEKYNISENSIKYIVGKCKKIGTIFCTKEQLHERRSSSIRGRKLSEITKNKISIAVSGKERSQEYRNNISKSKLGEKNGMFGKAQSKEAKEKMSEVQKNRKRKPLSEEQKQKIREALKGKSRKVLSNEIKYNVIKDYKSGQYTKNQIAEKYLLSFNSVVSIIRRHPSTQYNDINLDYDNKLA